MWKFSEGKRQFEIANKAFCQWRVQWKKWKFTYFCMQEKFFFVSEGFNEKNESSLIFAGEENLDGSLSTSLKVQWWWTFTKKMNLHHTYGPICSEGLMQKFKDFINLQHCSDQSPCFIRLINGAIFELWEKKSATQIMESSLICSSDVPWTPFFVTFCSHPTEVSKHTPVTWVYNVFTWVSHYVWIFKFISQILNDTLNNTWNESFFQK